MESKNEIYVPIPQPKLYKQLVQILSDIQEADKVKIHEMSPLEREKYLKSCSNNPEPHTLPAIHAHLTRNYLKKLQDQPEMGLEQMQGICLEAIDSLHGAREKTESVANNPTWDESYWTEITNYSDVTTEVLPQTEFERQLREFSTSLFPAISQVNIESRANQPLNIKEKALFDAITQCLADKRWDTNKISLRQFKSVLPPGIAEIQTKISKIKVGSSHILRNRFEVQVTETNKNRLLFDAIVDYCKTKTTGPCHYHKSDEYDFFEYVRTEDKDKIKTIFGRPPAPTSH